MQARTQLLAPAPTQFQPQKRISVSMDDQMQAALAGLAAQLGKQVVGVEKVLGEAFRGVHCNAGDNGEIICTAALGEISSCDCETW